MVDSESTVELPAPSSGGPLRKFVPRTFLDSKVTGRGWRWERKKALEASKVPLNYFVKLTADCDESIPAALDRATRKPNFRGARKDSFLVLLIFPPFFSLSRQGFASLLPRALPEY